MRVRLLPAAAALALAVPACAAAPATPPRATLTVFAAASLKGSFTELGRQFEAAHPGTTVRLNVAGSQTLVEQLDQGATADVLATADEPTMATAADSGLVAGRPVPFAANRLALVVPPGNPARVDRFADLARPDLALVVCAPVVPSGAAAPHLAHAPRHAHPPVSACH